MPSFLPSLQKKKAYLPLFPLPPYRLLRGSISDRGEQHHVLSPSNFQPSCPVIDQTRSVRLAHVCCVTEFSLISRQRELAHTSSFFSPVKALIYIQFVLLVDLKETTFHVQRIYLSRICTARHSSNTISSCARLQMKQVLLLHLCMDVHSNAAAVLHCATYLFIFPSIRLSALFCRLSCTSLQHWVLIFIYLLLLSCHNHISMFFILFFSGFFFM